MSCSISPHFHDGMAVLRNFCHWLRWRLPISLWYNAIILTNFSSLVPPEAVILTTSGRASNKNFVKITFVSLPVQPVVTILSKWHFYLNLYLSGKMSSQQWRENVCGLMWDCHNSSALAMELLWSCVKALHNTGFVIYISLLFVVNG